MKFWKLGLALSLTAVFGLMACDDSTSSDENGSKEYKPGTIGCTVTDQGNAYSQETRMDDLTIKMTMENKNGTIVETYEFNQDIPADTCDYYKSKQDLEYSSVKCEKRKITATNKDKVADSTFAALTDAFAIACKALDGEKIPDVKKDDIDLTKTGKCSAEKTGEEFVIEGTGVSLVCDGEFWTPSKADCTKEGEKKDFDTVKLVCKDKKWTFETKEDCSKAMKKSETFLDLVKFSATCVDGAWQLDLYSEDEATTEEE